MVGHSIFGEPRVWVAVAFVLFFVLFGRKIWQPLAAALDGRAARIRTDLDEAARLRREAEQMLEDATREREQALADAKALIEHSLVEASRIAEQAQRDAEEIASRREAMASERIALSERTAIRDVKEAAIEVAVQATRDVLAKSLGDVQDSALIDKSIAGLSGALGRQAA